MASVYRRVPFKIANAASKSGVLDLGPSTIVVGVAIHGTWTAAKIAFEGYVFDSGSGEPGAWDPQTSSMQGGAWDTNASFDAVCDADGVQIQWGNGTATGNQFISIPGMTAIQALRYVKLVSGSTASPVTQSQAVTGYILVRDE